MTTEAKLIMTYWCEWVGDPETGAPVKAETPRFISEFRLPDGTMSRAYHDPSITCRETVKAHAEKSRQAHTAKYHYDLENRTADD
jgi:hypothetical protein